MRYAPPLRGLDRQEQVDLLDRLRAGDSDAFVLLMRQNNQKLYRIARGILDDEAEAEDVVQDTYLKAFTHIDSIKSPYALRSWLARTAANEALGRLRRRKPVDSLDDLVETAPASNVIALSGALTGDNPELTVSRREMLFLVEKVIDDMPAIYRSVFLMRAVEGLSVDETATCLGLSNEVVKTRFHRAKKILDQDLSQMAADVLHQVFAFDGARCDRIVASTLLKLGRKPTVP